MPHPGTDELNGLLLFDSEFEDSTSPSSSGHCGIASAPGPSRETASSQSIASAPRMTTVLDIGSPHVDWLSAFGSESAPTILARLPATPPIAEETPRTGGTRDEITARWWEHTAARWIVPTAAAILLVAPSLLVGWHVQRTRANAERDGVDALAAPVLSATNTAPEVTPPPARKELPAAMLRGEESGQESAIRRTLRSYQEAYERLDDAAAADVWPAVDRRALSRAFDTLQSQELDFQSCAISVSGERATAHCRGTLQVVRKVGSPLTAEQQWVFAMRRLGGDWKIDHVEASQVPVIATDRTRGQ